MAIVHTTWLYRNDVRNYPFSDRAQPVDRAGLVDMHLTLPRTLAATSKRVYVSRLVVTNEYALVQVSLEDTGLLAELEVQNPEPYRMYQLTTADGSVHGFISFGAAARNTTRDIDQTYDEDSGEILESLIYRYSPSQITDFSADGVLVDGSVLFQGQQGVVCAIEDVYYDGEGVVPSMVIRLERDPSTMVSPVPDCSLLLESGMIRNLVTKINGVRPDTEGRIFLEFTGGASLTYDEDGDLVLNGDGNPVYDMSTPVIQMVLVPGQGANVLGFKDNLSYKQNCASDRNRKIVYGTNKCQLCTPAIDWTTGVDGAGGSRIAFAGAYITDQKMTVLWYYFGQGDMQAGPNIDSLSIVNDEGETIIVPSNGTVTQGQAPVLPGSLVPCTNEHSSQGDLGEVGVVEYDLSRPVVSGEHFALDIPQDTVQDTPTVGSPVGNGPVKTCEFTAQNPYGGITSDEQQALDEECF